jgi:DnaJ-domain-containing protein 1
VFFILLGTFILLLILFGARLSMQDAVNMVRSYLVPAAILVLLLFLLSGRPSAMAIAAIALLPFLPFLKKTGEAKRKSLNPASMTKEEACSILGVSMEDSEEEILKAYRRIIQKVHPDRGGSSYLTMQVKTAKDLLVKK